MKHLLALAYLTSALVTCVACQRVLTKASAWGVEPEDRLPSLVAQNVFDATGLYYECKVNEAKGHQYPEGELQARTNYLQMHLLRAVYLKEKDATLSTYSRSSVNRAIAEARRILKKHPTISIWRAGTEYKFPTDSIVPRKLKAYDILARAVEPDEISAPK